MRFLLITPLIVFICTNTFGTAQIPDKIIFAGETYKLHSNPLEIYFEQYPDKRPSGGMISTALWRGYIATFQIKNEMLVIKDIEVEVSEQQSDGTYKDYWKSVVNEVFPNVNDRQVAWFTGILILPHGKIRNYVHMGYGSTYSKYILLEIDEGNFTEYREYGFSDFEKFKNKQFESYKQTDEYQEILRELRKDQSNSDEFIEGFLRDFIINYTSKFLDE